MQRYFLKTDQGFFDKEDNHHILNVMRSKTGDKVIVCHQGVCHLSHIEIKDKQVHYHKIEQLKSKNQLDITIIQGLPKGNKVDSICKTATIFGASNLVLVPMVRSIAKLSNEDNKKERFEKIIKEAAELAHRDTLMQLTFAERLSAINWQAFDYILLADEEAKDLEIQAVVGDVYSRIAVVIGPEGGIDAKERTYFKSLKATLISLGAFIIPTELAHITALNALYHMKR